ncbi:MAG: DUF1905 domain-containing protein [Propionibacteriales bacterium]|nr:DUF1905 domain-containing protein [Propionibacteriales bacterium]
MTDETVPFRADLFRWGEGSWFFVRLPADAAEELRDLVTAPPRGFGSIRVGVEVGASSWSTSVFPEKETGSFVLPMKKAIRTAEGLDEGDPVEVVLTVQVD